MISNNSFSSNRVGLRITSSPNNTFTFNNFLNEGFFFDGFRLYHYNTQSIDTSNYVNSKPVYYWKNETSGTVPNDAGQIILANCTNVVIKDQTINNTSIAVNIFYSSNIHMHENVIIDNLFHGIYLKNSDNITINENAVVNTKYYGLYASSQNENLTISNNNFSYNMRGVIIESYWCNNIVNNIFFNNTDYGCSVFALNNSITNNTFLSNENGLSVGPRENIVTRNFIKNNNLGIRISGSNNHIYHNMIIDNSNQASDVGSNFWHNGYPSGGNFWSDYAGVDNFNGPYQNIPGSDGIGDTNYTNIGGGTAAVDEYPLMDPLEYVSHDIVLQQGWNLISLPLEQPDESIDQALGSIAGKWDCIRTYDPLSPQPWKTNMTGRPEHLNDFDTLDHTQGFWINVTEPGGIILTVSGNLPNSTSIHLYAGWNLVGYPTLANETVENAFWGTGADVVMIGDTSEPYHIREVGTSYVMRPGEGYWVHVPFDTVWVVDGTGPVVAPGFDWLITHGYNLVSCPMDPVDKGGNGVFDSFDALNICHAVTNDDNMSIQRVANLSEPIEVFWWGDDESTAFPMDGVHGYRINLSALGTFLIHVEAVNYTDANASTVYVDAGWTLLGFTHNYTPWSRTPRASNFTDGSVDPDLWHVDLGGTLSKIVVTEWNLTTQKYNSYVVDTGFPGMPHKNWYWDFGYSAQPGNAFWLWIPQPIEITFDTDY